MNDSEERAIFEAGREAGEAGCANCDDGGLDPTGYPCNCAAGHQLYDDVLPTMPDDTVAGHLANALSVIRMTQETRPLTTMEWHAVRVRLLLALRELEGELDRSVP